MSSLLLSVVIPTRNEEHNLAACISAFRSAISEGWCEVLIVDNYSEDATQSIATTYPVRFFQQGPERSTQRNRGWKEANGLYVFFVDADMTIPAETLHELQSRLSSPTSPDALYIQEMRTGSGWWTRVRNFERSFYNATCIDGLRVIRRTLLEKVGGYDETLVSCEDWDLDRRILALRPQLALTNGHLLHNEQNLTFSRHIKKKQYYSGSFSVYLDKWNHDAVTKHQFGFFYRFFIVFFEEGKWKQSLRHPIFLLTIWAERFVIGLIFLFSRMQTCRTISRFAKNV